MNELQVFNDSKNLTVSGRDLHAALQIKTAYKDWFPRMCDYGFIEGRDFCAILSESTGGRPLTNHRLTIDMAKQLCMIQRTALGRKFRKYFISIEEKWNSPESVMARALQIANRNLSLLETQNLKLTHTVALQNQQIAELQPKACYYDVVLKCKDIIPIRVIAKDYGKSAQWMNNFLHELGVQYKQSDIWLLYQKYAEKGYTKIKTHTYEDFYGITHSKEHTYWTQKGRLFLYDFLKGKGILPLIERGKNNG